MFLLSGWHIFYKLGLAAGHVCLQLAQASLLCHSPIQLLLLWLQGLVQVVPHVCSLEVVVRLSRPGNLADKIAFGRLGSNRFVRGCGWQATGSSEAGWDSIGFSWSVAPREGRLG
jgi:hypothetical protein